MADPIGFLRYDRELPARRPVPVRLRDWREVYPPAGVELVATQASRCMDCGVPFCHHGCPLGNRIPDWNDLVRAGSWEQAGEALHATDNFPEFTGRLCPAPCEAACVLGIGGAADPVAIRLVEVEISDRAAMTPHTAPVRSGRRVAVVGSGPAGLAAAQQLARAGHDVTVYERDDAIGGLLRYGIPDFKLEKSHIDRRVAQLTAEGVRFVTGCAVGVDLTVADLRAGSDAVVLAAAALAPRELGPTPGRHLRGVHQAMEYLVGANRHVRTTTGAAATIDAAATAAAAAATEAAATTDAAATDAGTAATITAPTVDAAGRPVVIIGGGDTAADCLGVAHRQGARSVAQLDLYPQPPSARDEDRDPWPTWPWILRTYPAHEEGGQRVFAVAVESFVDDGTGAVRAVRISDVEVTRRDGRRHVTPVPGTVRELPAELVLLAIGFDGTEESPLLDQVGLTRTRGVVACGPDWQTGVPGVFVAGDMHRGASLVVWAIAEGRSVAAAVHTYLGGEGQLPAPVDPGARPLHGVGRR